MRRFISFGPALVVLVTVVAALFAAPTAVRRIEHATTSARIVLARQSLDDDDILERINRAVRSLADAVEPSVVHIDVILPRGGGPLGSAGAGWVYDQSGHIVTNAHVVRGASEINVEFHDGRSIDARIVGMDPYTDIAVLYVPPGDGLYAATRATGEPPRLGDRVYAFGSPFGLKFSISEGIVSGLGRDPQSIREFGGFTNFLQTDAAVNPGNSGGPLVDVKGRVVGMNVAIATGKDSDGTTEGQSAGISFAIPLATIESVVTQLIDHGSVSRGFLGIQWQNYDDGVAYDPTAGTTGARIRALSEGGPAETSGLQVGDLITSLNGQPVRNIQVLRSLITSSRPGENMVVKAWRGQDPLEFNVVLGELPREQLLREGGYGAVERLGIQLQRRRDRAPVIAFLVPGSEADAAGLERGERIIRVGGRDVTDIDDMAIAIGESGLIEGKPVTIGVVGSDQDSGEEVEREVEIRLIR